jgi:hypothetical protein
VVINGTTRHALLVKGSGSATLQFIYRIVAGDSAIATQVTVGIIQLNSGTIKDRAAVVATKTFSAPSLATVTVN